MSVAFRRESDEEHLEPRFELPIPPGPNPVTPRGYNQIAERVSRLEADLRPLAEGDARTALKRELRYWRQRLASAEIVAAQGGDEVVFGSTVHFHHNGRPRRVTIVGHDEADATADLLGITAPLARALLGTTAGDTIDFGGRPGAIEVDAVS